MSRQFTIALMVVILVVIVAIMPVSAGPALSGNETIVRKLSISATISPSTVARGDRLNITGIAEGNPQVVYIWIFGQNNYIHFAEAVNPDGSFRHEVRQEETNRHGSGQFFVVVQHPGPDAMFNINTVDVHHSLSGYPPDDDPLVYILRKDKSGTINKTRIFDSGSLHGSDAAEALIRGIDDANVDDTYARLQFFVEDPVIRIDPIGDKSPGDKFTITAWTNLAVDDEILVKVNVSYKSTQNSLSNEFPGKAGTVKVTKGDSGLNRIIFDMNTESFPGDRYNVTMEGVIQRDAIGTAQFYVLCSPCSGFPETESTLPVVSAIIATEEPTQVVAIPTALIATPAKSPGFDTIIALTCLGVVGLIVVRRH